jgi:hypothetical protein
MPLSLSPRQNDGPCFLTGEVRKKWIVNRALANSCPHDLPVNIPLRDPLIVVE